MGISQVAVIGAGQMGSGIAQLCAVAGYAVLLHDISRERVSTAVGRIERSLERQVARGDLAFAEIASIMARIQIANALKDLAAADLVIEAASEDEQVKTEILRTVSLVLAPAALIATNTSSISIARLAEATDRPGLFVGIHFMNPPTSMKLVEVIPGGRTSPEAHARAVQFALSVGKTVVQSADYPAFILNRVLITMINEAIYTLYEGIGSVAAIDTAMKFGANQPMGPLELADFIGLDTVLAIMQVLHRGFGDPKYRPCPLLVKYAEAGWLGRKVGRGFYDYASRPPVPTR